MDAATLDHAQRLYAACAAFGVDIGAAALQFPLAHPAVITVVVGMRSVAEVQSASARLQATVPAALWQRLRDDGLLDAALPTP